MAATTDTIDGVTEQCEQCRRETTHQVSVEIRTESTKDQNAEFSREPYRVATCLDCGAESITRMNNA